MWWALIEIAQRAEEMTCEKETACCVRGYHVYKDIWAAVIGEVLVYSQEPTNAQKFSLYNYIRVKYFRTFSVSENIFCNEQKANYGILALTGRSGLAHSSFIEAIGESKTNSK